MKILLVAALIFAFGCAIKDRNYIQLLEAEILVRDLVIKDYQDKDNKNQGGLNERIWKVIKTFKFV